MIGYSRIVSKDALKTFHNALDETIEHVKAHLSSVADSNDSETALADKVNVRVEELEDRFYVHGELGAEPVAFYLKEATEEK